MKPNMYMTNRKVEDIVMQVGLPLNITRTLRPFNFQFTSCSLGTYYNTKTMKQKCKPLTSCLPENIGANFRKSLLPTSSPHLGAFHSNSKWSQYDKGHYWQASIVIHATDGLPLHALLREDVAENKCKVGYHSTHKSWWKANGLH